MASDLRLKEQLPKSPTASSKHIGNWHDQSPGALSVAQLRGDYFGNRRPAEIIFPGYHQHEGLHAGNIAYHVGGLIDSLHDKLTTQIGRILRHDDRVGSEIDPCDEPVDYEAKGQAIAIQFFECLPRIREKFWQRMFRRPTMATPHAAIWVKSSSAIPD